jgi:hypothetical protein
MEKAIKFDDWMRNKVKSIHYANNAKMSQAFSKIIEKNK